jgi:hypothetical protein
MHGPSIFPSFFLPSLAAPPRTRVSSLGGGGCELCVCGGIVSPDGWVDGMDGWGGRLPLLMMMIIHDDTPRVHRRARHKQRHVPLERAALVAQAKGAPPGRRLGRRRALVRAGRDAEPPGPHARRRDREQAQEEQQRGRHTCKGAAAATATSTRCRHAWLPAVCCVDGDLGRKRREE